MFLRDITGYPVADGARQERAPPRRSRRPSRLHPCLQQYSFPAHQALPYGRLSPNHMKCRGAPHAKTLAVGALAAPTITSAPVPAAILISSTPSPKRMACWALAHVSFCTALAAD